MTAGRGLDAVRYSLAQCAELARVIGCLERERIDAVAFKGPTLSLQAYGDPTRRPCKDLDVWVRRPDFRVAIGALVSDGLSADPPMLRASLAGDSHHAQLWRRELGIQVELHWCLMPPSAAIAFDEAGMWERRTAVTLAGRRIATLAVPDLVHYLAVHGGRHRWVRMEWLQSFSQVVDRHPEIDWDVVDARARASGTTGFLTVAFALRRDLLGGVVPRPFRASSHSRATGRLVSSLLDGMSRPLLQRRRYTPEVARMRERWRDRVRYLLRATLGPTARDRSLVDLPRGLGWVYAPLRVGRFLCEGLRSLARRSWGRGRAVAPVGEGRAS